MPMVAGPRATMLRLSHRCFGKHRTGRTAEPVRGSPLVRLSRIHVVVRGSALRFGNVASNAAHVKRYGVSEEVGQGALLPRRHIGPMAQPRRRPTAPVDYVLQTPPTQTLMMSCDIPTTHPARWHASCTTEESRLVVWVCRRCSLARPPAGPALSQMRGHHILVAP